MGKSESQMDIVERNPPKSKKSCKSWTSLEIGLTTIVVLLLIVLIALIALYATRKDKTCTTPSCVGAAARIIENMDQAADPCNNFYQYACGGWLKKHVIPETSSRYSTFDILRDEMEVILKDVLEKPDNGDPEAIQKAKTLFKSCTNQTAIERKGGAPLISMLTDVFEWPVAADNWDETHGQNWTLEAIIGEMTSTFGKRVVIDLFVGTDDKNSNVHIIHIDQPNLGLPSRDYYECTGAYKEREICHGLPPTPQVHMGACFSKVFNGCPLKVNSSVSWIDPKTRDQYLILGAEEGIYTLNLNELHEDTIEKLLPHRCSWLFILNNVLMSVTGKSLQLYSHNLATLFDQRKNSHNLHISLTANKLTDRIIPKKFAPSLKIPDTKGCRKCRVVRNPYTKCTFLCGVLDSAIILMQWYEPLQKFMLLKKFSLTLPNPLQIFELLVFPSEEYPRVCLGVRAPTQPSQVLQFDTVQLNASASLGPEERSETSLMNASHVSQLDRDSVLVCVDNCVKIVNMHGELCHRMGTEMTFRFCVQTVVCLQDSVLAFWRHGMQGQSLQTNEITQEITDETRMFRVLGTQRDIILESTPTDNPDAQSNLYILTGHKSTY